MSSCTLMMPVSALDNSRINNSLTQISGTYSSEYEKEYIINQIKKNNPSALVFTSEEEKELYFNSLSNNYNISLITNDTEPLLVRTTNTSEVSKDYCIRITTTLVDSINFYYSYGVRNSRFFTSLKGTPYLTYTGYTLGTECSMVNYTITRETTQLLDIKFTVNIQYYLLADGLVKLGSKDEQYHFKHDIATGVYKA